MITLPHPMRWCRFLVITFLTSGLTQGATIDSGTASAFVSTLRFDAAHTSEWTATGKVSLDRESREMGGYRDQQAGLTLQGVGTSVTVTVPTPADKDAPLLLEIQELHQRRPSAFGYWVIAGDQRVYFRSYEERGEGPNHYWVQVPREAYAGRERVTVTFQSAGNTPFTLGTLWVYHDFFRRVAVPEQVYRPMGLLGMELANIKPKPSFTSFAPIGRLSIVQYGAASVELGRKRFLDSMRTGATANELVQWMPNGTAWGGKPNGPDGRGGYFSDPRYTSLGFNPETGSYVTSWPNMWGNSASPSLHDPWVNQFLETRFQRLFDGLTPEIDLLTARGQRPRLGVIREWGLSSCELSPSSLEQAAKAGVNLDPKSGLDTNARSWMFREGVRLWQDYAESTHKALARASVSVDSGVITLPDSQILDEIYSQPDFLSDWPVGAELWSIGEQGMVPGFWSSGELGQGKEYRELAMYDYLRARGRLAMVNLERPILKEDFSVLKKHYARGFQSVTLFNDNRNDARFIEAVDRCEDAPALPAIHREPTLLAIDFRYLKALGPKGAVAQSRNIHIAHANTFKLREHRAPRLAVADAAKPGDITYRLTETGAGFPAGLSLHLNGRISSVEGNAIELWGGPSPGQLRRISRLTDKELPCPNHWASHMTSEATVDLGTEMIGAKEWFIQLVIHSPSAPDAAFLLSLDVGSKWSQRSGYLADNPFKAQDERTLQLWVQDRAVALDMLDRYARTSLKAAQHPVPPPANPRSDWDLQQPDVPAREHLMFSKATGLFQRGWYRSAYNLLAGELSQILPARYAVRGGGTLGCYPVEVSLPSAEAVAIITLHAVGPNAVEFSLLTDQPTQAVTLRFPQLDDRIKSWQLQSIGAQHFRLTSAMSENAADAPTVRTSPLGGVEVLVQAGRAQTQARRAALPQTLEGRYLRGDRKRITIDTQDLAAMDLEASLELVVSDKVTVVREADKLALAEEANAPWPKPLDAISIDLDEAGVVTAIRARYGRDRGRIKAFTPPTLVGNLAPGGIELDNGARYDFSYAPGLGTMFSTVALNAAITNYEVRALDKALRPGQEVEVTYCPYALPGFPPRLSKVTAPTQVLLAEDFTETTGDEWKQRAMSIEGLDVVPHKPEPNYLSDVIIRLLRPTRHFEPGSVVYRIKNDHPLGATALEFGARAFEDSSVAAFWVSTDGQAWTQVGQFDNTWQNNYPQSTDSKTWKFPPQTVDLTDAVRNRTEFFLKIVLTVGDADERFCFGRFRVLTERTVNP